MRTPQGQTAGTDSRRPQDAARHLRHVPCWLPLQRFPLVPHAGHGTLKREVLLHLSREKKSLTAKRESLLRTQRKKRALRKGWGTLSLVGTHREPEGWATRPFIDAYYRQHQCPSIFPLVARPVSLDNQHTPPRAALAPSIATSRFRRNPSGKKQYAGMD